MIETGQYKNDVIGLSSLSMKDYERIFKIYNYTIDDKSIPIYNILNTIQFSEIDSKYLDFYDVESKIAWTILSYKIYGDMKSWWILYLLNKDLFEKMPFYVEGGTTIKYITDVYRTAIYQEITEQTVFKGRHY